MFFVFQILLLTIYFSETNNYVLKRDSLGGSYNVYHRKNRNFQDDRNILSSLPTPKLIIPKTREFINRIKSKPALNKFVKKEPEEVIRKRHIKDVYTFPLFKSTKSISTSTPGRKELKRKLPEEFTSDSDNLNEYLHYFDEIEKKPFPFFNDIENAPKSSTTQNLDKWYLYQQNNQSKHSKDKIFDLRSLPSKNCQNCDKCVCPSMKKAGKVPQVDNVHDCTRRPDSITTMNFFPPYDIFNIRTNTPPSQLPTIRQDGSMNFPMGIGVPMGIPFGMPAGFGGMPVGVPANVPVAYAPGVLPTCCQENHFKEVTAHNKPCRHRSDHLYYNDDDDTGKIYRDNTEDYHKKKCRNNGEVFVNIDYDVEENKKPNNPNLLTTNTFKDFNQSYGDTVIKRCFCCSSSISIINNSPLSLSVIILLSNTLMLH
ncbi:uncharacterized protein LOC118268385 isoform X1 [Spodoptera frugiperda]|uniref:Uncharacterized protein LOC118268385 isoform X1 n=1 Tax=Spodoptera frugiperda TaxID=7108 RepID=A0A9R0EJL3_SPOFR|nr:uncharacterized protein LOC118268385 isoform X1 [Spodoptera frugiperda]